ncbi:MAG: glycosyltransferase family 4 protein [Neptuniibacter sp.]
MRLAHFETSMNWGGQELRIIEQMEWLLEHDHPCWLIARPGSAILKEAERRDLPRFELNVRGSVHPKTLSGLMAFLKKNQIEILDCHGSRDATYGLFVKYLSKTKVIRSRHVTTPIKRGALRDLVWRKGSHGIITTAQAINNKIVEQGLSNAEKIYAALPGVDEERFSPKIDSSELRSKYGIPPDALVIANIGMIRPDKGQEYFVEACAKLMQQHSNVYAIQMGEATKETQKYKQRVLDKLEQSGLSDRIKFLGYHHDIERFIAMADIVAVCSTQVEAQTRLVSQAFLMQKNVVASDIGGLPEMIQHEQTGLLVQPGESEAVHQALYRLISNGSEAEELKNNAYGYALEHFTFDKMMQGMLDHYQAFSH